ncbi:hypothetical protein [Janthinobacterium sp. LM6]|uniref:hypothetical protein n=1 Tax=Janthinobacterium sp. LM6 TaxID=1938606 RepID=UPI0012375C7E|nr:hypothetical protein [Janthinobacterium sp. LM6]
MKWKITSLPGEYENSDETKAKAKKEALAAVINIKINLTDEGQLDVNKLGKKWVQKIGLIYSTLNNQSKGRIDHLIAFSVRADEYACNYEALLRLNTSTIDKIFSDAKLTTASGCKEFWPCGTLLAQHYSSYCEAISASEIEFSQMPPTGIVLRALAVNRALQAALFIDKSIETALDLLCDASHALYMAGAGDSKADSYNHHKNNLRVNGHNGGKNRHADMAALKKWTIDKYVSELSEKKWKSANAAAYALKDEVIAHGKTIGANAVLAPSNAQRTIATWISEYKKSV